MNSIRRNPSRHSLNGSELLTRLGAGWLLTFLLALSLGAQETTKPSLPPGRFLFMVDTSLSMRSRAEGMLRAVEGLLATELDGRLRPGDSIGLWTFNNEVHAGQFPLQTWTPATRSAATANVLEFLRQQRYEKKTDLDKALRKALPLVRASPTITLLLFTDGEQPVSGTPFDDAINATFREARRAQARARMPFVTVLRAERGQITSHVVGLPPWPIVIPTLPVEQKALEASQSPRKPDPKEVGAGTVAAKPAPSVPAKPAETRPVPKPIEQSKSEAAPAKPPQPAVTVPAVAEKAPESTPVAKPPVAPPGPLAAPVTEVALAKPQSTVEPPKPIVAAPPPAPAPVPQPPSPAADAGKTRPIAVTPATVTEPAKPTAAEGPPVANLATDPPKPVTVKAAASTVTAPAETKPAPSEVMAKPEPAKAAELPPSQPATAEAKPGVATHATPTPVVTPPAERPQENSKSSGPSPALTPLRDRAESTATEPPPVVAAELKPAVPTKPRPTPAAGPSDKAAPVQTALAVPRQPFMSGQRLLVLGLLLLGVAGVLFFLIVRRSRAAGAPGSLITQSFDRDKKQP